MKSRNSLLNVLIIILFSNWIKTANAQNDIIINPNIEYQMVEGWGASLSWWANIVGDTNWPEGVVDAICNELTSPDELNMNIWRYNIHGGDDPQPHGTDASVRDYKIFPDNTISHFRWDSGDITSYKPTENSEYNWNANSSQRRILQKLLERNPNSILEATAYSPPYWMTESGCSGGNGGPGDGTGIGVPNLADGRIGDFADFLTDVVKHYKDSLGITFRTLTGLNEPVEKFWVLGTRQEGCHVPVRQQMMLIDSLFNKLQQKNMLSYCTPSSADENKISETWSGLNSFMHGNDILSKVSQINTHDYSSGSQINRVGISEIAQKHNLRVWQSESGPLGINSTGIDNYLYMAQVILDDLNNLHTNAWLDWQIVSTNANWGLYTFDVKNDWSGLESYTLTKEKSYYVRKQFSKYIKKNYSIINSNNSQVVSSISPDGNELVIVLINKDNSNVVKNFDLSKFASTSNSAQTIRTSVSENAENISSTTINSRFFTYTAPPQSITTFVIPVTIGTTYTPLADGLYKIKSKQSGKVLSVANFSVTQGAEIEQWDDGAADNLQFLIEKIGYEYTLKPKYNEFLFSVEGASLSNGAQVKQLHDYGSASQRYHIIPDGTTGYYKIVNKNSGLSLAVEGQSISNGANVVQWKDLDTDNFKWEFVPVNIVQAIPAGDYFIKAVHSNKFMSVNAFSTSNGAIIEQWEYVNQNNLKFTVTKDLAGYYKFKPKYAEKLITVNGVSSSNGAGINIYSDINAINQKFIIEDLGGNKFKISPKYKLNKSLAVSGTSQMNGANVVLWDYLGYDNFKWEFIPVSNIGNIAEGEYTIKAVHSNKYMSVAGESNSSGAVIEQWEYLDQDNFKFQVSEASNGYYRIKPKYNDLVVSVDGGGVTNGTSINISTEVPNASNQLFYFEKMEENNGENRYKISPKYNLGKALAVAGTSQSNGANIVLWDYLGYNNFKWEFTSTSSMTYLEENKVLSLDDSKPSEIVKIYPNPNMGQFYVKKKIKEPLSLKIFDIYGRVMMETVLTDAESEVQLNKLVFKKSIYLLKFSNSENSYNSKIVIND